MLEKIQDFFRSIKALVKKEEVERAPVSVAAGAGSGMGNSSVSTQTPSPRVFGVNRKMVLAVGTVLGVALVAALVNGFLSPSKKDLVKEAALQSPGMSVDGTIKGSAVIGGPSKYSEDPKLALKKYDTPVGTKNVNEQQMNAAVGSGQNVGVNGNVASNSYNNNNGGYNGVPAQVPQQQYYGQAVYPNYSNLAQQAGLQQATVKPAPVEESFSSPVRFAIQALTAMTGNGTQGATNSNGGVNAVSNGYTQAVPNMLQAGSVIPAMLISGITTDVPGEVVAQVRQDVYDSVTGSSLLIPQGSRLIGEYGGKVGVAQDRIGVSWKILILPNGNSFDLGGMPGTDGAGYAGLSGRVDSHTSKIFGTAALTSALGAVVSIAGGNTGSNSNNNLSAGQLAAQGASTGLINAATKMLERNSDIQPTITVAPGSVFDVFVNKTIVLESYGG